MEYSKYSKLRHYRPQLVELKHPFHPICGLVPRPRISHPGLGNLKKERIPSPV
jgi:hypothetical protein